MESVAENRDKAMTTKLTRQEALKKIRAAASAGKLRYQCCFCGEAIDGDITVVGLVTKWNGPVKHQREQQWFCHAECFTRITGERIDVLNDA